MPGFSIKEIRMAICLKQTFRCVSLIALLFASLVVLGCGGAPAARNPDEVAICTLPSVVSEEAAHEKAFKERFVDGAAPSDKDRLRIPTYAVTNNNKPIITGDTATLQVYFGDRTTNDKVGETTWTFEKQGGKWKIKTAPLP